MTSIDKNKLDKLKRLLNEQPSIVSGIWTDGEVNVDVQISEFNPKVFTGIYKEVVKIFHMDMDTLAGSMVKDLGIQKKIGGYYVER